MVVLRARTVVILHVDKRECMASRISVDDSWEYGRMRV